jgi:PAS domain S-box-containing protein
MHIRDLPQARKDQPWLNDLGDAIVESADDAIIGKDLNGIIQSWNDGAQRLFGYSAEEAIGRPITLLIPPGRENEASRILERIHRGERLDHYETVRRTKDGRDIPISLTISPIKDSSGNIVGASKIARDLSKQRQEVARELSHAQARAFELQAIIEAVPAAVLVVEDIDCRRVQANRMGHELLQSLRAAVKSDAASAHHRQQDLPAELFALARAAGGDEVRNWELKAILPDGRTHDFLGNAVPLRNESGQVCGAVAALSDITDRLRAETNLKEADRRKDEFLAMLAHELRNPLTPIKTALEIIHKGLGDQRRRDWALEVIDRQLVQLTRIIDDLLELGRIANGRITLKRESTSLRAIVSQALETSRPAINASRHALQVSLPLQEISLHADRGRLARAISNLLANAAKFTAPGGVVSIIGARKGDVVEIHVKDSGRGMDQELLPRVFDMFFQGATDLARTEGGLGVGLSIVRRIVELHGGTIQAYSEGKDKGSEFVVTLPLVADELVPTVDEPPANVRRRRVLVVDDNHDVTDSIAELLRLNGHEVAKHYEGNGVLDKGLSFRPDVMIIDLGLPGKTGYEVATLLRAHPEFGSLPLIALSGYGQPANVERSQSAGFNFHLLKPADPKLLLQLVETLVRRVVHPGVS